MTEDKYCIATKYFVDEIFYQLEMETSGAVPITEQQWAAPVWPFSIFWYRHRYFEQKKIFRKYTDTLNRRKYSRKTQIL